jgi:hypothetical protein
MILICSDNFHCNEQLYPSTDSGFSFILSCIAIVISLLTILITLYVVYITKRVEININKFNYLCLEPLESSFHAIFKHFESYRNDTISNHRKELTTAAEDLTLQLIAIKNIYPKLDINRLQNKFQEFTDKAYNNPSEMFYTLQSDFVRVKIQILSDVYDYALYKETSFLSLLFQHKKK